MCNGIGSSSSSGDSLERDQLDDSHATAASSATSYIGVRISAENSLGAGAAAAASANRRITKLYYLAQKIEAEIARASQKKS